MRAGDAVESARDLDSFETLILVDTQYELAARCYPARARSALCSTEVPHEGHLSCPRRPDSTRYVLPQRGQTRSTGLFQETKSQAWYRSQPKNVRPFFERRSTISPSPQVGQRTPIRCKSGRAFRHSGNPLHAWNFPNFPNLMTIGRPQSSQSSPAGSSFSRTRSIVCSARAKVSTNGP